MVSSKLLRIITTYTQTEKQTSYSLPLWALPTALSLDAPVVALLWQWFFARSFGLWLTPSEMFLLFATVWLIYTADRLLDSLKLDVAKQHTYRHAFYYHYRRPLSAIWLLILGLVTILSLAELSPHLLQLGLLTLSFSLLYGFGIHRFKPSLSSSKELQIGAVFALGTLVVFIPQLPLTQLWLPWLSFALLCSFNCYLIALAEKPLDRAQGAPSLAQQFSRLEPLLKCLLPAFTLALSLLALYLQTSLYLIMAVSSFGLYILLLKRNQLDSELLRVLADTVLLSPLLFILF